jgi:hypothetical protein
VGERTDVDVSVDERGDVDVAAGVDAHVDVDEGPRGAVAVGPLKVEPPRPTGDAQVDGVLSTLTRVGDLPTEAHGPVYEDVHQGLRDALAALDR